MVEHTMDVSVWLRKQLEETSPDLLRAMVQTFAEALMGADADAICGAPYGQRPVQQARGACQAARTRTATPSSARSSHFCCIAAGCRPGC